MAESEGLRRSSTIIDKIKLFEFAPPSSSPPLRPASPMGRNPKQTLNSFSESKLWRKSVHPPHAPPPNKEISVKDNYNNYIPKSISIEVKEERDWQPAVSIPFQRPSSKILEGEINMRMMESAYNNGEGKEIIDNKRSKFLSEIPPLDIASVYIHNNNELNNDINYSNITTKDCSPKTLPPISPKITTTDPQPSPRTTTTPPVLSPRITTMISPRSDPQPSPRKNKDKAIMLKEPEDSDEEKEFLKLHKLSLEEKQIIKSLVKTARRKNKTMTNMDEAFRTERENILSQFEAEKAVWLKELQSEQKALQEKDERLRNEEARNLSLTNRLRKTNEELHEAQTHLQHFKKILDDYKKNTDTELFNKSQSLLSVNKQLGGLIKLRESMVCVICEDRVAKFVLNPCHHLVLCNHCCLLVTQCPMCRTPISSKYEVYTNWNI